MLKRVTFIFAAVFGILLSAGCSKTIDLTPEEGSAIRFGAGSMLLNDDAPQRSLTRAAEFKGAFGMNDQFLVWGSKTISGNKYSVFTGQTVSLTGLGANDADPSDDVWEYSPLRFWDSNATRYDFLAVSGASSTGNIICNPAASGHLTATVTHNVTLSQSDLLAAGGQRTGGSTAKVDLAFQHVLSAVSVVIYNDSPLISVKLNSCKFRNLCVQASGVVQQDGNSLAEMTSSHWTPVSYDPSLIMGYSIDGGANMAARTHYPAEEIWDFMIPQSLVPYLSYTPQLYLDYEYDQANPITDEIEHNHPQFPIDLEEILVKNSSGSYITSWEPGKKYSYEIHIRLGGGVNVNVSVTDWEEILAETPGITLQ